MGLAARLYDWVLRSELIVFDVIEVEKRPR